MKDYLTRWVSGAMIFIGVLAIPLAAFRGIADYNTYESPFDQIDQAPENQAGFLPVLSRQSVDLAPQISNADLHPDEMAPTLEPSTANLNPGIPQPEAAPDQVWLPEQISIPAVGLKAPITQAVYKDIDYQGTTYKQWVAPDHYAVGWHNTSATLGLPGNTVLNGHHNVLGEVFKNLHLVERGDLIFIHSGEQTFTYIVGQVMVLEERFQPLDVRLDNASWILPSDDDRLTLITCWPYQSNTHRVIVVAVPITLEMDDNLE